MDQIAPDIPPARLAARIPLQPLALRLSPVQYARLGETRDRTGITIQEHIRRAIDLYLAVVEKEAMDLGLLQPRTKGLIAKAPKPKPKPARVAKR